MTTLHQELLTGHKIFSIQHQNIQSFKVEIYQSMKGVSGSGISNNIFRKNKIS